MNEKEQVAVSNTFEKGIRIPECKISTEEDIPTLITLRKEIDGVTDEGKLKREAEKFCKNKNGNLAIITYVEGTPAGYVEISQNEPFPDKLKITLNEQNSDKGYSQDELTAMLSRIQNYAHLDRIGVKKEFRGPQFGNEIGETDKERQENSYKIKATYYLMQEAEQQAKNLDKQGIWLEYKKDNSPAANLYRENGYSQVGTFTEKKGTFFSQKIDRVLVAKKFD